MKFRLRRTGRRSLRPNRKQGAFTPTRRVPLKRERAFLPVLRRKQFRPTSQTQTATSSFKSQIKRRPYLLLRTPQNRDQFIQRPRTLSEVRFMMGAESLGGKLPIHRSICERRSVKRHVLFSTGIAGKNRRNSPGAGGSYNRTNESLMTCRGKHG